MSGAVLSRLLLSATLALLPAPALADVTARYAVGSAELTIEADENGDWRVDLPGKFAVIRRDKTDYAVLVLDKETTVFKLDELIAAVKPTLPGNSGTAATDPFTHAKFSLVRGADVAVAGYKGTNWSLGPEVPRPGGHRAEIVTSKDPALAPIGTIFIELARHLRGFGEEQFGPDSNFLALADELLASGTLLRVEKLIELRSVDDAAIDPKRFQLPGPVAGPATLESKSGAHTVQAEVAAPPPATTP